MADAPVRLCCMQRHWTVACPDGLVMCELCFERFPEGHLMGDKDDHSKRWNVCIECGFRENVAGMLVVMAGGFKRCPRASRRDHAACPSNDASANVAESTER